jgi:hypothetical protein
MKTLLFTLILLACALWYVHDRQLRRQITALKADLAQIVAEHPKVFEHGRAQGRLDERARWESNPLYETGRERGRQEGWTKAMHDQAATACEMEIVRKSGELVS